jgi:hypothetical protein
MAEAASVTLASLPVGDQRLTLAEVSEHVGGFPAGTVRWYDFGGASEAPPEVVDAVTLLDLGRMTAMNPDVTGADAVALLERDVDPSVWRAVPRTADLADADLAEEGGLFDAANRLYKSFSSISNVKDAKTSKLLHLKRPCLYPILDDQVKRLYLARAVEEAARPEVAWRGYRVTYWAAIRQDLLAWREVQAFEALREQLHQRERPAHARLSDVRLLDITAWRLASR